MHALDFILVLFSFVYDACALDRGREHHRLRAHPAIVVSMRAGCWALLFTCAWWIGLWDWHAVGSWDIGPIAIYSRSQRAFI